MDQLQQITDFSKLRQSEQVESNDPTDILNHQILVDSCNVLPETSSMGSPGLQYFYPGLRFELTKEDALTKKSPKSPDMDHLSNLKSDLLTLIEVVQDHIYHLSEDSITIEELGNVYKEFPVYQLKIKGRSSSVDHLEPILQEISKQVWIQLRYSYWVAPSKQPILDATYQWTVSQKRRIKVPGIQIRRTKFEPKKTLLERAIERCRPPKLGETVQFKRFHGWKDGVLKEIVPSERVYPRQPSVVRFQVSDMFVLDPASGKLRQCIPESMSSRKHDSAMDTLDEGNHLLSKIEETLKDAKHMLPCQAISDRFDTNQERNEVCALMTIEDGLSHAGERRCEFVGSECRDRLQVMLDHVRDLRYEIIGQTMKLNKLRVLRQSMMFSEDDQTAQYQDQVNKLARNIWGDYQKFFVLLKRFCVEFDRRLETLHKSLMTKLRESLTTSLSFGEQFAEKRTLLYGFIKVLYPQKEALLSLRTRFQQGLIQSPDFIEAVRSIVSTQISQVPMFQTVLRSMGKGSEWKWLAATNTLQPYEAFVNFSQDCLSKQHIFGLSDAEAVAKMKHQLHIEALESIIEDCFGSTPLTHMFGDLQPSNDDYAMVSSMLSAGVEAKKLLDASVVEQLKQTTGLVGSRMEMRRLFLSNLPQSPLSGGGTLDDVKSKIAQLQSGFQLLNSPVEESIHKGVYRDMIELFKMQIRLMFILSDDHERSRAELHPHFGLSEYSMNLYDILHDDTLQHEIEAVDALKELKSLVSHGALAEELKKNPKLQMQVVSQLTQIQDQTRLNLKMDLVLENLLEADVIREQFEDIPAHADMLLYGTRRFELVLSNPNRLEHPMKRIDWVKFEDSTKPPEGELYELTNLTADDIRPFVPDDRKQTLSSSTMRAICRSLACLPSFPQTSAEIEKVMLSRSMYIMPDDPTGESRSVSSTSLPTVRMALQVLRKTAQLSFDFAQMTTSMSSNMLQDHIRELFVKYVQTQYQDKISFGEVDIESSLMEFYVKWSEKTFRNHRIQNLNSNYPDYSRISENLYFKSMEFMRQQSWNIMLAQSFPEALADFVQQQRKSNETYLRDIMKNLERYLVFESQQREYLELSLKKVELLKGSSTPDQKLKNLNLRLIVLEKQIRDDHKLTQLLDEEYNRFKFFQSEFIKTYNTRRGSGQFKPCNLVKPSSEFGWPAAKVFENELCKITDSDTNETKLNGLILIKESDDSYYALPRDCRTHKDIKELRVEKRRIPGTDKYHRWAYVCYYENAECPKYKILKEATNRDFPEVKLFTGTLEKMKSDAFKDYHAFPVLEIKSDVSAAPPSSTSAEETKIQDSIAAKWKKVGTATALYDVINQVIDFHIQKGDWKVYRINEFDRYETPEDVANKSSPSNLIDKPKHLRFVDKIKTFVKEVTPSSKSDQIRRYLQGLLDNRIYLTLAVGGTSSSPSSATLPPHDSKKVGGCKVLSKGSSSVAPTNEFTSNDFVNRVKRRLTSILMPETSFLDKPDDVLKKQNEKIELLKHNLQQLKEAGVSSYDTQLDQLKKVDNPVQQLTIDVREKFLSRTVRYINSQFQDPFESGDSDQWINSSFWHRFEEQSTITRSHRHYFLIAMLRTCVFTAENGAQENIKEFQRQGDLFADLSYVFKLRKPVTKSNKKLSSIITRINSSVSYIVGKTESIFKTVLSDTPVSEFVISPYPLDLSYQNLGSKIQNDGLDAFFQFIVGETHFVADNKTDKDSKCFLQLEYMKEKELKVYEGSIRYNTKQKLLDQFENVHMEWFDIQEETSYYKQKSAAIKSSSISKCRWMLQKDKPSFLDLDDTKRLSKKKAATCLADWWANKTSVIRKPIQPLQPSACHAYKISDTAVKKVLTCKPQLSAGASTSTATTSTDEYYICVSPFKDYMPLKRYHILDSMQRFPLYYSNNLKEDDWKQQLKDRDSTVAANTSKDGQIPTIFPILECSYVMHISIRSCRKTVDNFTNSMHSKLIEQSKVPGLCMVTSKALKKIDLCKDGTYEMMDGKQVSPPDSKHLPDIYYSTLNYLRQKLDLILLQDFINAFGDPHLVRGYSDELSICGKDATDKRYYSLHDIPLQARIPARACLVKSSSELTGGGWFEYFRIREYDLITQEEFNQNGHLRENIIELEEVISNYFADSDEDDVDEELKRYLDGAFGESFKFETFDDYITRRPELLRKVFPTIKNYRSDNVIEFKTFCQRLKTILMLGYIYWFCENEFPVLSASTREITTFKSLNSEALRITSHLRRQIVSNFQLQDLEGSSFETCYNNLDLVYYQKEVESNYYSNWIKSYSYLYYMNEIYKIQAAELPIIRYQIEGQSRNVIDVEIDIANKKISITAQRFVSTFDMVYIPRINVFRSDTRGVFIFAQKNLSELHTTLTDPKTNVKFVVRNENRFLPNLIRNLNEYQQDLGQTDNTKFILQGLKLLYIEETPLVLLEGTGRVHIVFKNVDEIDSMDNVLQKSVSLPPIARRPDKRKINQQATKPVNVRKRLNHGKSSKTTKEARSQDYFSSLQDFKPDLQDLKSVNETIYNIITDYKLETKQEVYKHYLAPYPVKWSDIEKQFFGIFSPSKESHAYTALSENVKTCENIKKVNEDILKYGGILNFLRMQYDCRDPKIMKWIVDAHKTDKSLESLEKYMKGSNEFMREIFKSSTEHLGRFVKQTETLIINEKVFNKETFLTNVFKTLIASDKFDEKKIAKIYEEVEKHFPVKSGSLSCAIEQATCMKKVNDEILKKNETIEEYYTDIINSKFNTWVSSPTNSDISSNISKASKALAKKLSHFTPVFFADTINAVLETLGTQINKANNSIIVNCIQLLQKYVYSIDQSFRFAKLETIIKQAAFQAKSIEDNTLKQFIIANGASCLEFVSLSIFSDLAKLDTKKSEYQPFYYSFDQDKSQETLTTALGTLRYQLIANEALQTFSCEELAKSKKNFESFITDFDKRRYLDSLAYDIFKLMKNDDQESPENYSELRKFDTAKREVLRQVRYLQLIRDLEKQALEKNVRLKSTGLPTFLNLESQLKIGDIRTSINTWVSYLKDCLNAKKIPLADYPHILDKFWCVKKNEIKKLCKNNLYKEEKEVRGWLKNKVRRHGNKDYSWVERNNVYTRTKASKEQFEKDWQNFSGDVLKLLYRDNLNYDQSDSFVERPYVAKARRDRTTKLAEQQTLHRITDFSHIPIPHDSFSLTSKLIPGSTSHITDTITTCDTRSAKKCIQSIGETCLSISETKPAIGDLFQQTSQSFKCISKEAYGDTQYEIRKIYNDSLGYYYIATIGDNDFETACVERIEGDPCMVNLNGVKAFREMFFTKADVVVFLDQVSHGAGFSLQQTSTRTKVFVVQTTPETGGSAIHGGQNDSSRLQDLQDSAQQILKNTTSLKRLRDLWQNLDESEKAEQVRVAQALKSWKRPQALHRTALQIIGGIESFSQSYPGILKTAHVHPELLAVQTRSPTRAKTYEEASMHIASGRRQAVKRLTNALGFSAEQVGQFVLMSHPSKQQLIGKYVELALNHIQQKVNETHSFQKVIDKVLFRTRDYLHFYKIADSVDAVGPAIADHLTEVQKQTQRISSRLGGAGSSLMFAVPTFAKQSTDILVRDANCPSAVERLIIKGNPRKPYLKVLAIKQLQWRNRSIQRVSTERYQLTEGGHSKPLRFLAVILGDQGIQVVLEQSSAPPINIFFEDITDCEMFELELEPGLGFTLTKDQLQLCPSKEMIVSRFTTGPVSRVIPQWVNLQPLVDDTNTIWCGSKSITHLKDLVSPLFSDDDFTRSIVLSQFKPEGIVEPLSTFRMPEGWSVFRLIQTLKTPANIYAKSKLYSQASIRSYFPTQFFPHFSLNLLCPIFLTNSHQ